MDIEWTAYNCPTHIRTWPTVNRHRDFHYDFNVFIREKKTDSSILILCQIIESWVSHVAYTTPVSLMLHMNKLFHRNLRNVMYFSEFQYFVNLPSHSRGPRHTAVHIAGENGTSSVWNHSSLARAVCSAQTLLTCAQPYNNLILTGEMVLFRPTASSSFLGASLPWLHLLIKVGPVILTIINVHNIADNNTKFIICDRGYANPRTEGSSYL